MGRGSFPFHFEVLAVEAVMGVVLSDSRTAGLVLISSGDRNRDSLCSNEIAALVGRCTVARRVGVYSSRARLRFLQRSGATYLSEETTGTRSVHCLP